MRVLALLVCAAALLSAAEGKWVAVEFHLAEGEIEELCGVIPHQLWHELGRGDFAGSSFLLENACWVERDEEEIEAVIPVGDVLVEDARIIRWDLVVAISPLRGDPRELLEREAED